jgi:RNA polymerase II-associated protein 1
MIRNIQEKDIGDVRPPSFPQLTSTTTGFPEHKKRPSAFKQQRDSRAQSSTSARKSAQQTPNSTQSQDGRSSASKSFEETQRRQIDEENQARLDAMSPEEIANAQRELLTGLDPSMVQLLLRRANLDDAGPASIDDTSPKPYQKPLVSDEVLSQAKSNKTVKFAKQPAAALPAQRDTLVAHFNEDAAPSEPPPGLFPLRSNPTADTTSRPSVHFPAPPPIPDLDPSDPAFLTNLHAKYFPNLPTDPSKLAWMSPLPAEDSPADLESPYHPSRSDTEGLSPSALRFSFRGSLIPPRLSRALPTSLGLHHHGDAPEAAGYTIPELAYLARSSVPAQRSVAFQTLGRIMYRLGKGEWRTAPDAEGAKEDDVDMAKAIWDLFEQGRVVDTLNEAAAVPEGQGHRGSKAYATEALWLLEKGGWKKRVEAQ